MRPALEELHAGEALERNDVARQCALRDQQCVGCGGEAAMLRDTLEGAQRIERQPATVDGLFLHLMLPRKAPCPAATRTPIGTRLRYSQSSQRRAKGRDGSNAFFRYRH